MTFSDFLQLMHSYIGCDVTKQDYVLYITRMVDMRKYTASI